MFKVEIIKRCGCFTKNGMNEEQTFKTKEEAQKEANRLLKIMNEDFCGKHKFSLLETGYNFKIVEEI